MIATVSNQVWDGLPIAAIGGCLLVVTIEPHCFAWLRRTQLERQYEVGRAMGMVWISLRSFILFNRVLFFVIGAVLSVVGVGVMVTPGP